LKYQPYDSEALTACRISGRGTVAGGQFNWGGCLLNGNGGVPRFAQGE
jgi:hypothetical protein